MGAGSKLRQLATAGPISPTERNGCSADVELRRSEAACAGAAPVRRELDGESTPIGAATQPVTRAVACEDGHRVAPSSSKVTVLAAVAALLAALYVEVGDEFFLVAASTALGLVVYWLADQGLGDRRIR